MTVHPVLAGLTPQQAAAAAAPGPVLVLAGAGTGKTKTLTAAVAHRIAVRNIPPGRIMAVTFTNKSAKELVDRIRATVGEDAAPYWVGTFHGLGARQLRTEPEVARLRPGFDILDADDSRRIVKRVLKSLSLPGAEDKAASGRDPLRVMCNRISRFKDELITPAEAPARIAAMIAEANATDTPIDAIGLRASAAVYASYQLMLRDANAADFGDLLLWPTRAMQTDPTYQARWSERFTTLAADEFQDLNLAQFAWLKLLAGNRPDVFAVGDDDQSIYSWRGGVVTFIRHFTQHFPGASAFRLEENFRSTGHILAAANAVIAQDRSRLGKTLYTRKAAGDQIEIVAFRNAEAEALGIVHEMQQRHAEGVGWDEMAVMYRANALSRSIEEALMRARIPYVLVGDVAFWQRAEIKDTLAFLRLADTPDTMQGDEALRRVINTPARGFGPKAMEELEAEAGFRQVSLLAALETANLTPKIRSAGLVFADAIRRVAGDRSATVADQLSLLLDATGYRALLRESRAEGMEGRLENVQELIALAGDFHSARALLDHAALSTGGPNEADTARVRLMTLHKGKGLEFPHVFLPAWESGIFPPDYGDVDEERRLAYVAITRAMRRATITHCAFRRGYTTPSRFLADIPDAHRVLGWLRQTLEPPRAHQAPALHAAFAADLLRRV